MIANTDLLAARARGDGADEEVTRRYLEERVAGDTEAHNVAWNAQIWCDAPVWTPAVRSRLDALGRELPADANRREWLRISRAAVFAHRDDPLMLFLAAMAWGFGTTGYGWYRTSQILSCGEDRVVDAVSAIAAAARTGGPEAAYRAFAGEGAGRLVGLGPAFASKIAYFAAFDSTGPLIVDLNTTWTYWALTGQWDSRYGADNYGAYVDWAERWAQDLDQRVDGMPIRADAVERVLFAEGPALRKLHGPTRRN